MRERFEGEIFGAGSTSGVRVVIGSWAVSPFGTFADAMVEDGSGVRALIAPSDAVAEYVAATYTFDRLVVTPIEITRDASSIRFASEPLDVTLTIGRRTAVGRLLRLVPRRLATAPSWATLIDPVARVVMRGVRTRGTAGNDRREWYGATDLHAVTALRGSYGAADLGSLAPIEPPVRFGFASVPPQPSVTSVVTTIER